MSKKDLFDDSTMTFGEHLEVLRVHLWRAIVGLVIGTIIAFYYSRDVIVAIQGPVDTAMYDVFLKPADTKKNQWDSLKDWFGRIFGGSNPAPTITESPKETDPALVINIDTVEIARKLHDIAPDKYPLPADDAKAASVAVSLEGTEFHKLLTVMRTESMKARTDTPDEAFMIYMKVSLILGVIISSPWVFYQLWLFVGAGLYSHERKYVYTYLPLSILL